MERELMTVRQDRESSSEVRTISPHRLSEFRKLAEDLSGKVENLLFVIWIQDQRHDYWMKFIKEVRTALEVLKEEIEHGEGEGIRQGVKV